MARKNRFSACYGFFITLAMKKTETESRQDSSGMRLAVMIVKEQMKKEFGIKSLIQLNKKELKRFERFLKAKI